MGPSDSAPGRGNNGSSFGKTLSGGVPMNTTLHFCKHFGICYAVLGTALVAATATITAVAV